jgi:hypothetical protein
MMDKYWELHSHCIAEHSSENIAVWNLALLRTDFLGNALRSTMISYYWELWPTDILGYALNPTMMDNNWELHSHYSADAVWNLALSPTDILGNALRSTMMDNYWELWPPDIHGNTLRSTMKDYNWELFCEALWTTDIVAQGAIRKLAELGSYRGLALWSTEHDELDSS